MKVAVSIVMNSDEREIIENFIHCLGDYCRANNHDCTQCKFDDYRLSSSCPIGEDWIYHLIEED